MSKSGALPDGWTAANVAAVAGKPQYGWTTKAKSSGDVRLLRTTDISSGHVDWNSVPWCETPPADITKFELHPGDVVVSRAGSVGFSYLVDESCPPKTVFASYLMRIRPDPERMSARWLRHYMHTPDYWTDVIDSSVGVGIANMNGSKLAALELRMSRFVLKFGGDPELAQAT